MICVECKNTVDNAYLQYKGDYITLQKCDRCHGVVDKYIEYDNVLLFLDIVLLKPQAYRHICFNVTETQMKSTGPNPPKSAPKKADGVGKLQMFTGIGTLARFSAMIVLFEVYLGWAYEEKKTHHSQLMAAVLNQPVASQYGLFILNSVLNLCTFNFLLQLVFFWLQWDGNSANRNLPDSCQQVYKVRVLLTGVLIANSIRLLPILTLIWPYDNSLQLFNIVKLIAVVNIIESLKVISQLNYFKIISTFLICYSIQHLVSTGTICVIVAKLDPFVSTEEVFLDHYQHIFNSFF